MKVTADLNNANCLQSVTHIGSTTYVNVCHGTSYTVAWGAGDWAVALFIGLFLLGLVVILVGLGKMMLFDSW